jgi:hypothetical protein
MLELRSLVQRGRSLFTKRRVERLEETDRLQTCVSDPCVILGGQPRSGTSLLTSMLRESDDLFQAFELHVRKPSFVTGNGGNYTRNIFAQMGLPLAEYDRIVACFSNSGPSMNLGAWVGLKEEVSAERLSGNETSDFAGELAARCALVASLMRKTAQHAGKRRWGFKILGDIIYADMYAHALPNAVFILLVRDPRDHALSVMKLNEQRQARGQQLFYPDYRAVARGWAQTIGDGRRVLEQNNLKHVVLRYEDLTAYPERQLRALGEALDLDLSRSLDFYKQDYIGTHTERFKHHDKLKEPVNTSSVGKWRKQMSADEISVFAEEAGELMRLYGYET